MVDWIVANQTVAYPLIAIYTLLVVGSILVRVMIAQSPEQDYTSLRERISSWWVMVTVFSAALIIGGVVAVLLFAFISFLALREYLTLAPARSVDRRVFLWAFASIPVQYYAIHAQEYGWFIIIVPVYFFLLISIRAIIIGETKGFIRSVGTIHWGLMVTVYCLGHLAYLYVMPGLKTDVEGGTVASGAALVLYVVMLTQGNDVFQFIWGKTTGKRKIAPSVSPGKTWEGFLGGVFTTTLVATFLGPRMTPLSMPMAACSGLIISVGGFFGDLLLSSVKRDLGVKDTGCLLPGHGGILDRVDSLTVAAPLMLHFFRYFYF